MTEDNNSDDKVEELKQASQVLFAENEAGGIRIKATHFKQERTGFTFEHENSLSWGEINKPFSPIDFEEIKESSEETASQRTWEVVVDALDRKIDII